MTYTAILVCLGLAAVGCTSPTGQETEFPSSSELPDNQAPEDSLPENTPETDPNAPPNFGQADAALSDLTGQLAISTDTGELWVMAPDGFGPELVAGGNGVRANQPTWLKNSSALAYSYFDLSLQGIGYLASRLRTTHSAMSRGIRSTTSTGARLARTSLSYEPPLINATLSLAWPAQPRKARLSPLGHRSSCLGVLTARRLPPTSTTNGLTCGMCQNAASKHSLRQTPDSSHPPT